MNNAPKTDLRDDPTWEAVLESLASRGYLSHFYRIPRHELAAMMKLYSTKALNLLGRNFAMTQAGQIEARDAAIAQISDPVRFVMLGLLVRSMKCWVETESYNPAGRGVWRVAHS